MSRRDQARWIFWHTLYGIGRLFTLVLFVLLDRPPRKRKNPRS